MSRAVSSMFAILSYERVLPNAIMQIGCQDDATALSEYHSAIDANLA